MSKRRRVLAGRHWLHAGKRKETAIGYLCSRGHYVFKAEGPEEDACQSKNVGTIFVRQLRSPGGWPDERLDEFVTEADESLGRHLKTWRKSECDDLRARLAAVTETLRRAEAKVVELAAYGEKRYQQWQEAEALLDSLAADVTKDARTRGDADMRSIAIAAAHIRNRVEDYKIHRDAGHLAADCPLGIKPNTKEQNVAFRKAWDARYEAGQKRKEEKHSCPHCYEDVEHEDDHLVGDKDVNAWFECPVDKGRPVA